MIFESINLTAAILLLSMLISGYCSCMESAYLSLDRIAIKKLENSQSFFSRLVLYFVDHLNYLIVSILIFNLFSNIIATLSANKIFFWYIDSIWGISLSDTNFASVGLQIVFVVLFTLMILIFSEFIPKRITIYHPKFFAQIASVLIIPVYVIMFPIVFLIFRFSLLLKNLFSINKNFSSDLERKKQEFSKNSTSKDIPVYRHDLLGYVEKISRQGGFHKIEADWLVHLLFYMNTPISSIMVNRENLVGINFSRLDGKNLLPLIKKFPFANIPLYQESKDNIIGIVSKKEIALEHRYRFFGKEDLKKYIKKALLLPKTKNILEILRDIYHSDLETALIVDEHGGVEGIVSENHIITKIFERVGNEDSDTLNIKKTGLDLFSIRSEVSLNDVNQFFGINLSSEKYETLGGYLLEKFKHIPKKGESVGDDFFTYVIKSRTHKKIIRIEAKRKS